MYSLILFVYQAFSKVGDVGNTCDSCGGEAAGGTHVRVLCKTYESLCYSLVHGSDHVQLGFL